MLSVLRDPPLAIPRKGRPKWPQRLQTSAEKIQKVADRIKKPRRCKSCSKVEHNRRTCPKLKMEDTQEIESEAAPNPREMWADAMSAFQDRTEHRML
ncbi:hypothetical protein V1524DRAFT_442031 [Lipomyces starkeyi]